MRPKLNFRHSGGVLDASGQHGRVLFEHPARFDSANDVQSADSIFIANVSDSQGTAPLALASVLDHCGHQDFFFCRL